MGPPQILRAPRGNRICMEGLGIFLGLLLLGNALLVWLSPYGHHTVGGRILFTLFWAVIAMLLTLFAVWHLSLRAELHDTEITRRSIFGAKSLRLSDIESALFSSYKGVTFLTVRSKNHHRWLTSSTYTFSDAQLHQIQDFLRKSSDAIRTSRPQLTTNHMINFTYGYLLLIFIIIGSIAIVGITHRRSVHGHSSKEPNSVLVEAGPACFSSFS